MAGGFKGLAYYLQFEHQAINCPDKTGSFPERQQIFKKKGYSPKW
jgi:hypothetical protein